MRTSAIARMSSADAGNRWPISVARTKSGKRLSEGNNPGLRPGYDGYNSNSKVADFARDTQIIISVFDARSAADSTLSR